MTSRRFELHRSEDVHGNSGTGVVAEGTEYTNGAVALTFLGTLTSYYWYPSMHPCKHLHGHEGKTKVVWIDPPEADDIELIKGQENDEITENTTPVGSPSGSV